MPTNKNTMTELMNFRTMFLRAVAQAWADPEFRKQLLAAPEQALWAYFQYRWPWPNACELQVVDSKHRFNWTHNEWVWSNALHEDLFVYVPLDPDAIDAKDHAVALADYYRARESLFQDDWGEHDNPNPQIPQCEKPSVPRPTPRLNERERMEQGQSSGFGVISEQTPLPAEGLVPSDNDFAAFQVALLAAMGRAWQDLEYRELLQRDAIKALAAIRGYKLPWDIGLRVQHDPGARWNPPHLQSNRPICQSYWSLPRKAILRLALPERPERLVSEPIALAMYNATGAIYPFTCTC